jgi:hypothetical protein
MEDGPHPGASSIAVTTTSEDVQQKRKISDLLVEEEPQALGSDHAVKRYGPRHYT